MERFSKNLAAKIAEAGAKDKEQESVIAYGLLGTMQLILQLALTIALGLFFNILGPILFLSFTVSILRSASGGAHADSINLCTVLGLIYAGLTAQLAIFLGSYARYKFWFLALSVLIFILSRKIISQNAPVASTNKPLGPEKRKRLRQNSLLILYFYGMTYLVLFIISSLRSGFLVYCYSLIFGLVWQVFSLTRPGAVVLGGLNKAFLKKVR